MSFKMNKVITLNGKINKQTQVAFEYIIFTIHIPVKGKRTINSNPP